MTFSKNFPLNLRGIPSKDKGYSRRILALKRALKVRQRQEWGGGLLSAQRVSLAEEKMAKGGRNLRNALETLDDSELIK